MGDGAKRVTTVIETGLRAKRAAGKPRPHSTSALKDTSGAKPGLTISWAGVIEAQAGRAILWLPFAVMIGAASYFAWPFEPPVWGGPALGLAACAACLLLAAAPSPDPASPKRVACLIAAALMAGLAAGALGFTAGQWRAAAVQSPRLTVPIGPVGVEGWVVEAAMGASRPRLKILVREIEGVEALPRYVEISTTQTGAIQPGRAVRCFAILRPVDGAMAPGAYDAAFNAYFERVGGTGFSYGACRPGMFEAPDNQWDNALLTIAALRRAVTETIADAAPGRGGAVAAALVTGDLSLIDPATTLAFRNSGLGHMLSVSGLHMGLVSGIAYAALHLVFALIGPLALRYPVRKWAAAGALLVTAFYLVLSGNSVPAQRAFVLIGVAMGAILVNRPAITMRGLAVAALIVTLMSPDAVVTPGFQMSFAASAALVAAFEDHARRRANQPVAAPGLLIGALQRSWDWLFGALLASAVAGLASDPFALMHFQRMAIYALPINLVATPVTSLLIAPAAIVGAILSPFGWGDPAWALMGSSLDFLIAAASVFADRPEAVRYLPRPPEIAFALCIFAIAWGCLWRGALRWIAVAPFVAGIAIYATAPRPVIWMDGGGQALLARAGQQNGARWTVLAERGAAFETERLGQLAGLGPNDIALVAPPERCAPSHCAWRTTNGRDAFLVITDAGLQNACVTNSIVVTKIRAPPGWRESCRTAALVGPDELSRRGGVSITERPAAVEVRFARREIPRAWTAR